MNDPVGKAPWWGLTERASGDPRSANRAEALRGGRFASVDGPDDEGSMSVVVVGLLAVLMGLCAALATYAHVVTDAERVRLAADQATLAGASVVLGVAAPGGAPCDVAHDVAQHNGASLETCTEMSTGVQVTAVRPSVLTHVARATARAGAPESDPNAEPVPSSASRAVRAR